MSSGIAAFFHGVSEKKNNSLHGRHPEGSDRWCRYQRAKAAGSLLKESKLGLPRWCSISFDAHQQKRKQNERNNIGCSFPEAEKSIRSMIPVPQVHSPPLYAAALQSRQYSQEHVPVQFMAWIEVGQE
ncbi:hypothetical protein TNCV_3341001 [Trichonephila clavipes]|nr:hypothetical protein TNCV_3341001 [Trichonephila clavipes]